LAWLISSFHITVLPLKNRFLHLTIIDIKSITIIKYAHN